MTALDDALAAVARGWFVFPCKANKRPYTEHGWLDATGSPDVVREMWKRHPQALVGIATGPSGLVVIDLDVKGQANGLDAWHEIVTELGPELEDTCIVETPSGGMHLYYQANGSKVGSTVGRLAPGIDTRAEGGYVIGAGSPGYLYVDGHGPERLRPLPEALAARLAYARQKTTAKTLPDTIAEGERNATLFATACGLRDKGVSAAAALTALREENRRRCKPPLPDSEVENAVQSAYSRDPRTPPEAVIPPPRPAPAPLGEAAYHGPLGRWLRLWEPKTEADPAAMLLTALAMFGSIVGAGPRHYIGVDAHPARLFVCVVGNSATARKGTSMGPPLALFKEVDPEWSERCILRGLSTGEGLIHRIRDARTHTEEKEDGTVAEIVDDAGVSDKRLFVKAGEFARVLAVMTREGNTLSQIVRELYDTGDADNPTKHSAETVHGAHVAMVAHITLEELRRTLTDTEAASGFANRYLWVYAERRGSHPVPTTPDPHALAAIARELRRTMARVRGEEFNGDIPWDKDAERLYRDVYEDLNRCGGGLSGACIARGPAQVSRLALTYALADCCYEIGVPHLKAALEVWRYCAESARYAFGERTGNDTADRILAELRARGQLTRTEISRIFGGNKTAAQIAPALACLRDEGLVAVASEESAGGGRPVEVWRPC